MRMLWRHAALQLAKDKEAKAVVEEIRRIEKIDAEQFAAAFAFAAIPTRYPLERRQWAEAAELVFHPQSLSWDKFPQAQSIVWFGRGLGAARGGPPRPGRASPAWRRSAMA
jgi:hypothetical protein